MDKTRPFSSLRIAHSGLWRSTKDEKIRPNISARLTLRDRPGQHGGISSAIHATRPPYRSRDTLRQTQGRL